MLNKNACQLGTNLALMLYQQNKDLTPVAGSLVEELSNSAFRPLPTDLGAAVDIPLHTEMSSVGDYDVGDGAGKTYYASKHDALMDNYVDTLASLVRNHVQFARTVVYPKINYLSEQVALALQAHEVQQPEDFFEVTMYRLPEVFESDLVATEVMEFHSGSTAHHIFNFGDSAVGELNLQEYVCSGDLTEDALISSWIAQEGVDKLRGYVFSSSAQMPAAMPPHEQINSSFINFLFYRALAMRQDLNVGRSVIQLVTTASDNRDHHALALRSALQTYRLYIKQGILLAPQSEVGFSYLSDRRFAVMIYEESFNRAAEEGATLEQVFGYITLFGNVMLTTELLKKNGDRYTTAWNTVRGLYMTHITGRRDVALKMTLKLEVIEALYQNPSQEETDFYAQNHGFQAQTAEMVQRYVHNLDTTALERTQEVFIDLIAGIGFRHSSAGRIIREMVSAMERGDGMEAGDAALQSTVKYVTDFLVEQVALNA